MARSAFSIDALCGVRMMGAWPLRPWAGSPVAHGRSCFNAQKVDMPFLQLPDAQLFYSVHGEGSPVLLHHGWCCDGQDWAWVVPALARHHRVIVMDARGHGRSSVAQDYGFETQVGDVIALIEHLGVGPVRLVGHSLGGAVVSGVALRRPDLAACVVAVDPAYGHPPEFSARLAPLAGYLSTRPQDAAVTVQGLFGHWSGETAPGYLRVLLERRVLGMAADAISGSFVGLHEADLSPRDRAGPMLARRTCPVLSFHSIEDSAAWESSVFTVAHSRAVALQGRGHWLQVEAAEELSATMLAWFIESGVN